MTVVDTIKDTDALTLTVVTELDATPERVWRLWSEGEQLGRWWGPPGWPATFPDHDLTPGAESRYYMTGPDGTRAHGWWRVLAVDPPRSIEIQDGFSDADGNPDDAMPAAVMRTELTPVDGGTRMTITTRFPDAEAMAQVIAMGMEEGMREAVGQIPELLAEG